MKRREFVFGAASLGAGVALSGFAEQLGKVTGSGTLPEVDVRRLSERVKGNVVLPGNAGYEQLRRVLSLKVDRHPALIVHCATADDVRRAVDFARSRGLPIAVRCGGHSIPGHSTCDGGLLIDLSGLKGITVDPVKRVARVQGGVLAGELDHATAAHDLATVLGECPSVGLGGFTLGGGEGPLMGAFGIGADNLRSAEVVLADSRMVTANAGNDHADLFWAVRGGGGNFGIATAFEFNLHPVSQVFAGSMRYKAESPKEFLQFWRDFAAAAPDELTMILHVGPSPGGDSPTILLRCCWCGDLEKGEKALAPLRAHGYLVSDSLKRMPYLAFQSQGPSEPTPVLDETRSGFIPQLNDAVIGLLADGMHDAPPSYDIILSHLHGAISRVKMDATAFPLREPGFDCWITAEWNSDSTREKSVQWVRRVWSGVQPHTRGAYVNGLEDEGETRVRSAYGENYTRLAKIKKRYDPNNTYRFNQNVKPSS